MDPEEMMNWQNQDMIYAMERQQTFMIIFAVVTIVLWIYMAIAFMRIAAKTQTPNGWLAWIPIANIALMLMIAKRPMWWVALLLIPFVNIVIFIIVSMDIAKNRGKPAWIGALMVVPFVNLFIPGYLAFSK